MKTILWGMIGCGDVTERKSGPGFYKAANSTLVAVMRRNGALAQDYPNRHRVERWHDDAEMIISATDIDAIYIATLPDSHYHYALRCAEAGKTVYVEKPMAMNFAESSEMIASASRHGVPLWVGYYRRALPRFLKIQQLLQEGTIGAIRFVTSRQYAPLIHPDPENSAMAWRLDPSRSGGAFSLKVLVTLWTSSTSC
jgi:predicted dehydrogenase